MPVGDFWIRLERCCGVEALVKRQRQKRDVTKNVYALLQFPIWHKLFIEGDAKAHQHASIQLIF
ncbi:hypothetical protein MNBD_GAMMA26-1356 [hydrothermal vent metagenome]|uniref:Uncharacterized protein n=1 Tax=hydrothermal vent metagenome TaxID=652676 RepID=A0A3B1B0J6_9ZZZZ